MFVYLILLVSVAAMLIKPFDWPEAVWITGGALLLLITGLISPVLALKGVEKGQDVYYFLIGMMLLAELARQELLFDWLAAYACLHAGGSPRKLFILLYLVGILVTTFLSNDATAVVLTPAVAAAVRAAKVRTPLPYLLICAWVANAASFVLPIANPANLVVYGSKLPDLPYWLAHFSLPSVLAISITFFLLYSLQKKNLPAGEIDPVELPHLPRGGVLTAVGIALTALVLLAVSYLKLPIGLPTLIAGIATAIVVSIHGRKGPKNIIKGISWSMIPLVAGLFVMVEALSRTGVVHWLNGWLNHQASHAPTATAWVSGILLGLISNLTNNLPSGLLAAHMLHSGNLPSLIRSYWVIAIDLGPNLSITGSLATILWIAAVRREGIRVDAGFFLKLGALIMIPSLIAAFLGLLIW
ncbi:MAG: anion permease [Bacteroidota bacterium]|nr:anion permease [Bacteroidota bacterium]